MDNLRNFDLNLLIVFEAVYSAGNVSHAAKLLNQSQNLSW
jgi:DNA-binding transcriptional LysR family regulator